MRRIQIILQFWFEGVDDRTPINKKKLPFSKWFVAPRGFDQEIKELFENDLQCANGGELKDWEATPEGRLALILLLDQFSRNIYRGTPQMYAFDTQAQTASLEGIAGHQDQALPLIYRVFFYMPLMHSEDLTLQEMSVRCFEGLVEASKTVCPDNMQYYRYTLKYAREHAQTIREHGRFFHREKLVR